MFTHPYYTPWQRESSSVACCAAPKLRGSNNSIALVSTSKGLFLSLFSTKIAIYTAPVEEKLSPEHNTQHGSYWAWAITVLSPSREAAMVYHHLELTR